MVAHAVAPSDEQVLIEQGREVRRPSNISVDAAKRDNHVVTVRIGGNCVDILRGEATIAIWRIETP